MRSTLKVGLLLPLVCACGEIKNPSAVTASGSGGAGVDVGAATWALINVDTGIEHARLGRLSLSTEDIALFVDSKRIPHIAFARWPDNIEHAWLAGEEFQREVIDETRLGWYKSWAVGADDVDPILVFGGYTYGTGLFQARHRSGMWETSHLESSDPDLGAAAPAATRRDGTVHEVRVLERALTPEEYPDSPTTDGNLLRHVPMYGDQIAPFAGPGTVAIDQVPPATAIAVDAASTVHILYTAPPDDYAAYLPEPDLYVPFTVRYATIRSGQWSDPETLSEQPGAYGGLSLAIDESGTVHASFGETRVIDSPASTSRRTAIIRYLQRAAGQPSWLREAVIPDAPVLLSSASLGVDRNGDVYVVYCRASEESPQCNALGIAQRTSGEWSWEVIDDRCLGTGQMATLAVDDSKGLHVAYRGCDDALAYAYRAGSVTAEGPLRR